MNLELLFGEGEKINALQMSCRGAGVFLVLLFLLRISGRRSFGIRTASGNTIMILLGALLSRIVTGASPFIPVMAAGLTIAIMHRIFGWVTVYSKLYSRLIDGHRICLYEHGEFIKGNMHRALVCEEDVMHGVRKCIQTEDLSTIKAVYMERNGEITVIR